MLHGGLMMASQLTHSKTVACAAHPPRLTGETELLHVPPSADPLVVGSGEHLQVLDPSACTLVMTDDVRHSLALLAPGLQAQEPLLLVSPTACWLPWSC
jgi:hypothetical protein